MLTLGIVGSIDPSLPFAYGYPFVLAPFVQEAIFSSLIVFVMCQESAFPKCVVLFLDHLFLPTDLFNFVPHKTVVTALK